MNSYTQQQERHIRSLLEQVGVTSVRAAKAALLYTYGCESEFDKAFELSVWREAATKSGDIYHEHAIVVFVNVDGYYDFRVYLPDSQSLIGRPYAYSTRSRALLAARRYVMNRLLWLQLEGWLADMLDAGKLTPEEYSNLQVSARQALPE